MNKVFLIICSMPLILSVMNAQAESISSTNKRQDKIDLAFVTHNHIGRRKIGEYNEEVRSIIQPLIEATTKEKLSASLHYSPQRQVFSYAINQLVDYVENVAETRASLFLKEANQGPMRLIRGITAYMTDLHLHNDFETEIPKITIFLREVVDMLNEPLRLPEHKIKQHNRWVDKPRFRRTEGTESLINIFINSISNVEDITPGEVKYMLRAKVPRGIKEKSSPEGLIVEQPNTEENQPSPEELIAEQTNLGEQQSSPEERLEAEQTNLEAQRNTGEQPNTESLERRRTRSLNLGEQPNTDKKQSNLRNPKRRQPNTDKKQSNLKNPKRRQPNTNTGHSNKTPICIDMFS